MSFMNPKDDIGKTLEEVLPREFKTYWDERSFRYKDVKVKEAHYSGGWPGSHKNVMIWYVLENDIAVGWNESPSRGWAFPCHSMKKRTK